MTYVLQISIKTYNFIFIIFYTLLMLEIVDIEVEIHLIVFLNTFINESSFRVK